LLIPLKSVRAVCFVAVSLTASGCFKVRGVNRLSGDGGWGGLSLEVSAKTLVLSPRYDSSLMRGTLPGEGADHPSVTDTSVIV